ncbi:pentapeptide repeat-containing protein [Acerihabitans sp.]|uniref:pentapeptide repeat-containing protein n=1 Tax=Acerihabitans sp. TaxID=2811394 RepID=UPI0039C88724
MFSYAGSVDFCGLRGWRVYAGAGVFSLAGCGRFGGFLRAARVAGICGAWGIFACRKRGILWGARRWQATRGWQSRHPLDPALPADRAPQAVPSGAGFRLWHRPVRAPGANGPLAASCGSCRRNRRRQRAPCRPKGPLPYALRSNFRHSNPGIQNFRRSNFRRSNFRHSNFRHSNFRHPNPGIQISGIQILP